jgi:hypothetical protein
MRNSGMMVMAICLAMGCGGGTPEVEEPVVGLEAGGQAAGEVEEPAMEQDEGTAQPAAGGRAAGVAEDRPMSLIKAIQFKSEEIRECIDVTGAPPPGLESLMVRISYVDCGSVVAVGTVIGDDEVDKCLMETLADVQIKMGPTSCKDDWVKKTYTVLMDMFELTR